MLFITKRLNFDKVFKKVYSSAMIGYKKPHKEFFEFVFDFSFFYFASLICLFPGDEFVKKFPVFCFIFLKEKPILEVIS